MLCGVGIRRVLTIPYVDMLVGCVVLCVCNVSIRAKSKIPPISYTAILPYPHLSIHGLSISKQILCK